jgi:hypothetical protein
VVIHENYDQETKVDKQTNQISLSSIWLLLFRNLGQQHRHCDARVARQIHGQNFDRLRAESVPPRRLFRLRANSRMGKRQGRRKKFGCPPPNERWDGQQPMVYWNSHAQKWISRPHDVRHCNSRILSGRAILWWTIINSLYLTKFNHSLLGCVICRITTAARWSCENS